EVLPVKDAVDREREVELPRDASRGDLLLERPIAGDPVVFVRVGALDRDLDVVEPGRLQSVGAIAVENGSGGDQRRIPAGVSRPAAQLNQIAAQHRLASRQRELQYAKTARLPERADPILGPELPARAVFVLADLERVRAVRAVQRALV